MAINNERTIGDDEIVSSLSYNKDTGVFTWKIDRKRTQSGSIAGFHGAKGYWQIRIKNELFYAHRLAYFFMTGNHPARVIDHIDGNRSNNSWSNLRLATYSQNSANASKKTGKTSALKGVSWDKRRNIWVAFIRMKGRSTYLGTFTDEMSAHIAYCKASKTTFGEFARVK